jgi:hypothetical protein
MRYFPQRARMKTSMSTKLGVCTYCLGDLFADGRCVQCHARIAFGSARQPAPPPVMAPANVRARPALN